MTLPQMQSISRAVPVAQKVIAAAAISGTYALVGTVFADPTILLIIVSTLDQAVQLSFNGTTDHLPLPAGATLVLDFKSDLLVLGAGAGVYVKEIGNPTTGSLYVSSFTSTG